MVAGPDVAQLAVATLAGYLLFWLALHVRVSRLSRVGSKVDLSHGIYHYA
jgi:hypothetical protein